MRSCIQMNYAGDDRCEFAVGCLAFGDYTCNCESQYQADETEENSRTGLTNANIIVQPGTANSPYYKTQGRQDIKNQSAFKNRT